MNWENPRSDRGTPREAQNHGLMGAPKRTVGGAIPPRAKRTVPHECAGFRAEPHGLFLPKQKALERHARQLLFWNFFSFWERKKCSVPSSKEFWNSFAEKRSKINKNLSANFSERTVSHFIGTHIPQTTAGFRFRNRISYRNPAQAF